LNQNGNCMNRNELRPGNWVYTSTQMLIRDLHVLKNQAEIINKDFKFIRVQLFDDILRHCGFSEYLEHPDKIWSIHFPQSISYIPSKKILFINEIKYQDVIYLHQIQNYFYDHIGSFLEIKK
jgi:hypothetical protein